MTDTSQLTDIHDIKPLTSIPFTDSFYEWIWLAAAVLLIIGGGVALWRYWRRKRQPSDIVPEEILLPPETVAIRKLNDLAGETWGDARRFYFELSDIFRVYLGQRFSIEAIEMTTEELLPAIERLAFDRDLTTGIRDFLLFSDPIKFANMSTSSFCMERDLDFVRFFVRHTTPDPTREAKTTEPDLAVKPTISGR